MGTGANYSDSSSYQHERVPLIHHDNDDGSAAVVELGPPQKKRGWMILAGGATLLVGFVSLGMTVCATRTNTCLSS